MTIFTTDDLNPSFMDFFHEHVDVLHDVYPNFKIYAFTTPRWAFWPDTATEEENDVLLRKDFIKFCVDRKDWLILAAHGLTHKEVFTGDAKTMLPIFQKSKEYLDALAKEGCSTINAFKPPFYKYNHAAIQCANEAGFGLFFTNEGIIDLQTMEFIPRVTIGLLDSHTNPKPDVNMMDRIDLHPFDEVLKHLHELRIG